MKKLLSTITFSALVGTSASNLKPMFTNNVVNHGFKSNSLNNKNIIIQNENNTNPFEPAQINSSIHNIGNLVIAPNETIFVGTDDGVYKSTDGGLNFSIIKGISNITITNLATDKDGNVYASDRNDKIYKSNGTDDFTTINGIFGAITSLATDKDGNVYAGNSRGIVYKSTDGSKFTPMSGTTGSIRSLAVDNKNNIYAGSNNGTVYKSTDGSKFTPMSGTTGSIRSLATDKDGNVYAGTTDYSGDVFTIYKSNGTNDFLKINNFITAMTISSLSINNINNNIYVGTNRGLYQYNPINLLLKITKPNTFDKSWPLYKGIVYNSAQKIDIKENLVASAKLDNKSITIPTTGLDIPADEHNLVLTLKDKTLASVFGGDTSTGQVSYKLWVKTSIDKSKIDYSTKIDDTQLYTGLVSNAGKTNGADIIQTKSKDGTGSHDASLNIDLNDPLIDFDMSKSFYESGTVDSSNNFIANSSSKQTVSKNLSIQKDGIYHLHLEDTVGNTYDSYLELGESNWKLTGTFNDTQLNDLARKLTVTFNLTDTTQKTKALGWLHQYENFVDKTFEETIKNKGKGFESEIKKQITSYKAFLNKLEYKIDKEPKFDDGIDKDLLVKTITDKANEFLKNGLNGLPQNLNVDTKNVVNKSTLTSYTNWINNYQDFINKNKDKWINDIEKIASRGFATAEQVNQIKSQIIEFLNNDTIKKYLKNIVWEDNKLLKATSSDYQQYIELDKLQSDTIDWVNQNLPDINNTYQKAINDAESNLNLHGYSIDKILNGKSKPQTKSEIDNFADGQSYHEWLQSQANIKFHGWQLTMGLSIGITLLLIGVIVGCFIYRRTNPKYHGYWRGKKENKKDNKELIKSIKSPKKAIKKQENE